jgi:two-component system phosphate regulon response regulator PhoB
MRILVAEDDPGLRDVIVLGLADSGYHVDAVDRGDDAIDQLKFYDYDVAILDWRMPGAEGIEVVEWARRNRRPTAILMLTARDTPADRIRGLDSGADDYVVKPFSPSEVVARLRAVIRRAQPEPADDLLRYADVAMDLAAHRVTRDGRPVHLGPTEYRLLHHFLRHPGRVFSRERLLDRVWGEDSDIEMRTVDVHIRRLREKVPVLGDSIETIKQFGYRLLEPGA